MGYTNKILDTHPFCFQKNHYCDYRNLQLVESVGGRGRGVNHFLREKNLQKVIIALRCKTVNMNTRLNLYAILIEL